MNRLYDIVRDHKGLNTIVGILLDSYPMNRGEIIRANN